MPGTNSTRAKIGFHELGIAGVLKGYRLQVPLNQREYRWESKQVTTLFQDLKKAIDDEDSEYFLGTIVTIPRELDSLEVVDGQQRLATIAILLAEMRNYLRGTSDDIIAKRIDTVFLTEIDPERREESTKLALNVDDNDFFRSMITAGSDDKRPQPTVSSHSLIKDAFEEARKHTQKIVGGLNKVHHGDALNRWVRYLEHGARVILLEVPTGANAYKMFETLNDRGLKTSQADLVKNYLLEQAGDKRKIEAQQKWARMRNTLETLDEDDITVTFLRQAMTAMRGHLRESEVFERVQQRAKGPTTALQFLSSLEGLAGIYVAIFNPEHERWNSYPESIRRAILTLNLLNIKGLRPAMLAVAAQFSPKEANEAFRMFITWGVRFVITSKTSRGSIDEQIGEAANLVFTGEIKTAAALYKKVSDLIPVDEEFRRAFEIASVSQARFARYYLRSLEMAAKGEKTPWFIPNDDPQVINLEHILPEEPGKNWPEFDEEIVSVYTRRIGNLALLLAKSNSDLRSSDFKTKKAVYKDSAYELTRMVARVSTWTKKEIAERQKTLANLALKAWPLEAFSVASPMTRAAAWFRSSRGFLFNGCRSHL